EQGFLTFTRPSNNFRCRDHGSRCLPVRSCGPGGFFDELATRSKPARFRPCLFGLLQAEEFEYCKVGTHRRARSASLMKHMRKVLPGSLIPNRPRSRTFLHSFTPVSPALGKSASGSWPRMSGSRWIFLGALPERRTLSCSPGSDQSKTSSNMVDLFSSRVTSGVLSAPSRKWSSSTMLVFPTALRLWSSVEVVVRSATKRLSPGPKEIARNRGSLAFSPRNIGNLSEAEDVLTQPHRAQGVENVEGEHEPPERQGSVVVVVRSPFLAPAPCLGHGDALAFTRQEDLGPHCEQ